MHRNKNNIFTYFKRSYKNKTISFYKICINFPYLFSIRDPNYFPMLIILPPNIIFNFLNNNNIN